MAQNTTSSLTLHSDEVIEKGDFFEKCNYKWILNNFQTLTSSESSEFDNNAEGKCRWKLKMYRSSAIVDFFLCLTSRPKDIMFTKFSLIVENLDGDLLCYDTREVMFMEGIQSYPVTFNDSVIKAAIMSRTISDAAVCVHTEILSMLKDIERVYEFITEYNYLNEREINKEQESEANKERESEKLLSEDLLVLLSSRKFSDVVLLTDENEKIEAHRNILSARSPKFEAIFNSENLKKKRTVELRMPNFTSEVVYAFLEFIYTGSTSIRDIHMAINLLRLAEKSEVVQLKVLCSDYVAQNLGVPDVEEIFLASDLLNSFTQ